MPAPLLNDVWRKRILNLAGYVPNAPERLDVINILVGKSRVRYLTMTVHVFVQRSLAIPVLAAFRLPLDLPRYFFFECLADA